MVLEEGAVSGSFRFLQGLESFCGHMALKFLILPKQTLKSVEIQEFCIGKYIISRHDGQTKSGKAYFALLGY